MCSTEGCGKPTVFRTRTKAAWCKDCIDCILRLGGLEAVEPVRSPTVAVLMRCRKCGTPAHYRLDYVVGNNEAGIPTCRACFWRTWAAGQRALLDRPAPSIEQVRSYVEAKGYEYLGPLTSPSLADDPHHVRCRACGKISAERVGDFGSGCGCSRNGKSASKSRVNTTKSRARPELFKDSGCAVIAWWDHAQNSEADFETASLQARRVVAWKCPTCSYRFTEAIAEMVRWTQCPRCERERREDWGVLYEALKSTMVTDHPGLAAAWDDPKDPATVPIVGGWGNYRFACGNGHHPRLSPYTFLRSGCPHCRGAKTRKSGRNPRLAQECPEIASQWHPTRNGKRTPEDVPHNSKITAWWRDPDCGHEWEAVVTDRNKYQRYRCPQCHTILDSLAYQYPLLAQEWSADNPLSAWQVRPHGQTAFEPEWVCTNNSAHVWHASLTSRTNGSDCPECRQAGKSAVELDYFAAAKTVFGSARSGVKLRSKQFSRRPAWTADIIVGLQAGEELVIEYDGAYWHRAKGDVDRAKSLDLLAGGYRLVRLREHPLPPLDIKDSKYAELVVYSTAPDPERVMERIREGATGLREPGTLYLAHDTAL